MLRQLIQSILLLSLIAAIGCQGTVDLMEIDPETGETKTVGQDRDSDGENDDEERPPPFELSRESVQLLPFHVRLSKVARVVGVEESAPIFDDLRGSRYDLGDHNYAQGIGPNLQWNASKMALWVETMRPVCQSDTMRQRYPFLPEHLNELLGEAYGREATEDDLVMYDDVLAETEVSEEERYEAVCLAVLTSTEFVAR